MKKIVSLVLTAVLVCTLLSVFVLPASAETAEEYMIAGADLKTEGRYKDAADAYGNAAIIYQCENNPVFAADAWMKAGECYEKTDKFSDAGTTFYDAASLYQGASLVAPAADAYMKAGDCFEKAGELSFAVTSFDKAAGQYNKANDYASVVIAHAKAGKCYEKENDLSDAKNAFGSAALAAQDKVNELQNGSTGSILSGGSLVIIVGVAAFVLGLGAAFVVMCVVRKRRNKDDS